MIAKRSEADILAQAPLKVKFGEKEYDIRPLTILKQRAWRERLNQELKGFVEVFNAKADQNTIMSGLTGALVEFPEKLVDMVFLYAPYLPKEEIMNTATEEQIAFAFSSIMAVAFPFLAELGTMTKLMQRSVMPLPPVQ
jgi:hypothetical protein